MGEKQLRARLSLLRRIDGDVMAETWMHATNGGLEKPDTVMLVADPEDDLMLQLLARPGMEKLPRQGDVVVAPIPSQLAAFLCQGNENEAMKDDIMKPPPTEGGGTAFWCMVIAIGGITLVPVHLEADA